MPVRNFYNWLKRLDKLHRITLRFPSLTYTVRAGSYAVYRALEVLLGRHHPHGRVIHQARELGHVTSGSPTGSNVRVLFFTVRGWFVHVGTEAVLAKALELRGADTSFFLCGGQLAQCDFKPGSDPYVTKPLCWRCSGFAKRLLEAFDLPCSMLDDLIDTASWDRANRLVSGLARSELDTFTYDDLPLYEIVKPSVHRSLLRGDIGVDEFSESIYRGFLESAVLYVDACKALLNRQDPTVVVMTNGLFFAERIMLEVANQRGIACVTYERGMPVGTILLAHDKPVIRFDLDEPWKERKVRELSEEESRSLDEYVSLRRRGKTGVVDIWPRIEFTERKQLIRQLGLRADRPILAAFPNVLWDSTVYDCDLAFDSLFDWLESTIRAVAGTDLQLVVRAHPAEVRVPLHESRDRVINRLASAFPTLPDNTVVISPDDSTSSYPLIDLADLVLVYTSTIGLEAATVGKRVVVSGETHYRRRGFTHDVEEKASYQAELEAALKRGAMTDEQIQLARRYAHLFFLEFQQPFPWIADTPRSERRLQFDGLEDLLPGRDATLDRICEGIMTSRPFL